MESNSIPPFFYDKLVKKHRLFRIILILILFAFLFLLYKLFFATNNYRVLANTLFFLLFLLYILYSAFSHFIYNAIMQEIVQIHNWSNEQLENLWKFKNDLYNFGIFSTTLKINLSCNFSGNFYNRDFNLYELDTRHELSGSRGSFKHYFLVQTAPIADFKNTILIKPHQNSLVRFFNPGNSLTKIEFDTQGVFDIYVDNPQNINESLTTDFMSKLVSFGKTMKEPTTFLITPKGALFLKRFTRINFSNFFAFSSSEKQVVKECQKMEDFIGLLDLFNLLEKK